MSSEDEVMVQKNMANFCKIIAPHVEIWRSVLQESAPLIRGIANRAEQYRYVHEAKIKYIDNFDEQKNILEYNIMTGIEEELVLLNKLTAKLNKANVDMRNKLTTLERSTLNINWDSTNPVIKGSWSSPSLSRLLQAGLEFSTFFQNANKNITTTTKEMNWLDAKSMNNFEKSFTIDLNNECVNYLLAITQYVDNEKNIV